MYKINDLNKLINNLETLAKLEKQNKFIVKNYDFIKKQIKTK